MSAYYRSRSNGKNSVYIALGGGAFVLMVALILYIKFKSPPAPELLQQKTVEYFKVLASDELYKAYKMESIAGKLPLARYEDAVKKHYQLRRRPNYKTINAGPSKITLNNAVVPYKIDAYYDDTGRIELMEGELKFHRQPDGWRKEPEEFLLKALKAYDKLLGRE